jgi:ribosome-associated heat shock protein Hsp15
MRSARPICWQRSHNRCRLRLDKFLYFARFAKSRSKAQALILGGNPRINGRPVTTLHQDISVGSTLTIAIAGRVCVIAILALPPRRGPPAEAQACYTNLSSPQVIDAGTY